MATPWVWVTPELMHKERPGSAWARGKTQREDEGKRSPVIFCARLHGYFFAAMV
jgi:hypothetical protein